MGGVEVHHGKKVAIRETKGLFLRARRIGQVREFVVTTKGKKKVRGTRVHGKPCSHVTHAFAHRGGSRAKVLKSVVIRRGKAPETG